MSEALLECWEGAVLQPCGEGRAVQELCRQYAGNVEGLQELIGRKFENATASAALDALLATADRSPPPAAAGTRTIASIGSIERSQGGSRRGSSGASESESERASTAVPDESKAEDEDGSSNVFTAGDVFTAGAAAALFAAAAAETATMKYEEEQHEQHEQQEQHHDEEDGEEDEKVEQGDYANPATPTTPTTAAATTTATATPQHATAPQLTASHATVAGDGDSDSDDADDAGFKMEDHLDHLDNLGPSIGFRGGKRKQKSWPELNNEPVRVMLSSDDAWVKAEFPKDVSHGVVSARCVCCTHAQPFLPSVADFFFSFSFFVHFISPSLSSLPPPFRLLTSV